MLLFWLIQQLVCSRLYCLGDIHRKWLRQELYRVGNMKRMKYNNFTCASCNINCSRAVRKPSKFIAGAVVGFAISFSGNLSTFVVGVARWGRLRATSSCLQLSYVPWQGCSNEIEAGIVQSTEILVLRRRRLCAKSCWQPAKRSLMNISVLLDAWSLLWCPLRTSYCVASSKSLLKLDSS